MILLTLGFFIEKIRGSLGTKWPLNPPVNVMYNYFVGYLSNAAAPYI